MIKFSTLTLITSKVSLQKHNHKSQQKPSKPTLKRRYFFVKSDVFYGLVLKRSGADFKLKMKGGVIFAGQAGRSGLFSFHQKGG